jgi:hypothetical protein
MPKIVSEQPAENESQRFAFFCPGCKCAHWFNNTWQFNGDVEKPTISPSILVTGTKRCHSFVKEGNIQFLSDCDHELKDTTCELPDF